jgi:hypothetical protein
MLVPAGSAAAWKMSLDNQAQIQQSMCSIASPAIPESWAIRIGTDRPQLVIVYAEVLGTGKLTDSRWSLTIPHYRGTSKTHIKVPSYRRGNWNGSLRLSDGSQIVVNAATSFECKRVLNRLKIMIPVQYRVGPDNRAYKPRVVENPNLNLKECNVIPTIAKYFATGQKSLAPTWAKDLRKP